MESQKPNNCPDAIVNDEIDLVQLFQILLKRKTLIITITLLVLLIGLVYALVKKPVYEYTTTIQVGTTFHEGSQKGETQWIEDPDSVKLKLDKVYIPAAVDQLEGKYDGRLGEAVVKTNKNSNILLITSKGTADDSPFFNALHLAIVKPLIANHRELIAASKNQYELLVQRAKLALKDLENPKLFAAKEIAIKEKLESAQLDLVGLKDKKKLLVMKKKGLEQTKKLLRKEITKIEENLKLSYAKRDKVVSDINDSSDGMTFLMLNSDIQRNENRLAQLRERLDVKLVNENHEIDSQIDENIRSQQLQATQIDKLKTQFIQLQVQHSSDQAKQKNTIAAVENKINLYQDSKVLGLAARSLKPSGASRALIVALAGILGLMCGVMSAFFAEFMAKVRRQQKVDA